MTEQEEGLAPVQWRSAFSFLSVTPDIVEPASNIRRKINNEEFNLKIIFY